jgi:plasmid stabilization system protein ParE
LVLNAQGYGADHADKYVDLLKASTLVLSKHPRIGKAVEKRPNLRFIVIKRRSGGQGHIAVYFIEEKRVVITNFFHTAQDWKAKIVDT